MKKSIFVAALMVVLGASVAYAQPRAIGANLGGGLGFSYQHGFGEANMLDLAVYVPLQPAAWGLAANITYDWIDPFGATVPWNEKGEWHWYMGVGGGGGIYGYTFNANQPWFAGVAGHIGIEYDFWFPFQLSIDWRPVIGVVGAGGGIGFNVAGLYQGLQLGVRYKF